MNRRALALAVWLGCSSFAAASAAADVEVLRQTGDLDKRFNIAVLGDGYRAEDQAMLRDNAQAIIDYLFEVSPLREYAQFFNVKLVHVVSNQNGADNGSYGAVRDTALGAYFNCDNIDRLLCIDDAKTQLAAAQDVPEYNFAVVLVNDPKYGGSGGPVCVSSSNEQSFEVLAHEIGHSLARLADEYSYEGNQPACDATADCPEANVTMRTLREQIKWRAWVDTTTPLPTPATSSYEDVVGLFEGGRYASVGVYRPQQDCKMRDLGLPYCAVCREQFVRSIWSADNVRMIEATQPPQSNVTLADCEPLELAVTTPPITPSTYQYSWMLDGHKLPGTLDHVQVVPLKLGPGEHDVSVTVRDTTSLVRNDPDGLLNDVFEWKLSVARDDCPVIAGAGGLPSVGGSGSGGGGRGGGGNAGGLAQGGGGDASGAAGETSGGAFSGNGGATEGGALGSAGVAAGIGGGGSAGSAGSGSVTAGVAGSPAAGNASAGDGTTGGSDQHPTEPHHDQNCGCSAPGSGPRNSVVLVGMAGAIVLRRRRRRP